MDNKLIAKLLSKGGFKESSIVLESGRSGTEKNSAVSGVRRKGSPVQNSNVVESVRIDVTENGNATTAIQLCRLVLRAQVRGAQRNLWQLRET